MPTIPKTVDLDASSAKVLNTIRANASPQYQTYVPKAIPGDVSSLRAIGNALFTYEPIMNEFLPALLNRIGRVLITSKMYDNPWASFKKGLLEYGETVEEIFVNICEPHEYNPEVAQTELFKIEKPDVRAAFHTMNYQKFYKKSIFNDQLRQAFLSWQGITDLIAGVVDSMYTSANNDEFLTMKYMIGRLALTGNMNPVNIPAVTADNARSVVTTIKGISNDMEFLGTDFNPAGVYTYSNKNDQYLIVNSKFSSVIDVEVLALSFHMDKAEFMGHMVLVNDFGKLDVSRLDELFAEDPTYVRPTKEDLEKLSDIPAILVDKDFFMIFDNFYNFTENYNGQGLYWQYFYHVWKTFSSSPYANRVLFTTDTPAVTGVTVNPGTASVAAGGTIQLSVEVATTGFAPSAVAWTSNNADATVTASGMVTVKSGVTAGTKILITVTSTFDNTKSAFCEITTV